MRKRITGFLVVFAGLLAFFTDSALADKKVVVVSGLNEAETMSNESFVNLFDGIKTTLAEKKIDPIFLYCPLGQVESGDARDEAELEALGMKTVKEIKEIDPGAVIVASDVAVRYVAVKMDEIPIVVCLIYSDPKELGLLKPNITGVIRRSYAGDIWTLAGKLTGAKTLGVISKHNLSMEGVRTYLLAGAEKMAQISGVRCKEMYLWNTFAEWKKNVETWPFDLIYLADTNRIEKNGQIMSSEELTRWTVDNAKVPVIAAVDGVVKAGALLAIETSEVQIGKLAASMALKILSGIPVSKIPMEPSSKGKLIINVTTAEKMNINIPYDVLSVADKIYK